jgi:DNA-nicking Smr family endonuclease
MDTISGFKTFDTGYESIDLHLCTVVIAIKRIEAKIAELGKRGVSYLEVIHGFHQGKAIRQAILDRRIRSKRIERISAVPNNDGRTGIYLKGGFIQ